MPCKLSSICCNLKSVNWRRFEGHMQVEKICTSKLQNGYRKNVELYTLVCVYCWVSPFVPGSPCNIFKVTASRYFLAMFFSPNTLPVLGPLIHRLKRFCDFFWFFEDVRFTILWLYLLLLHERYFIIMDPCGGGGKILLPGLT